MYKHFMRCNICWYCIRFEEFTSFFLFLKYFDCSLHIRLINIFDFYQWISHKKKPQEIYQHLLSSTILLLDKNDL